MSRPKRRAFYEIEPPRGWIWRKRRLARGEPRPYQWRDRFRRFDDMRRAMRVLRACPEGATLRQYVLFKPTETFFLGRVWVMR